MGSYVGGDTSSATNSVTELVGVTWPAHSGDDLALVAHASADSQTAVIDVAFTILSNLIDGSLRAIVAKRTPAAMTGAESGDIELSSGPTGNRQVGTIAAWSGYTDVQQIVNKPETGSAIQSHACPEITPQLSGSGFVLVYLERVGSSATPIDPPLGFTRRLQFATGGSGGTAIMVADDLSGTHGLSAFTPGNVVSTTPSAAVMVYLVELAPLATTITGTVTAILPVMTATGAGDVRVDGAVSATLAAIISAIDGDTYVGGTFAGQLPVITALVEGGLLVDGSATASLPILGVSLDANAVVSGDAGLILPVMLAMFDGTVDSVGGDIDALLPVIFATSDGDVRVDVMFAGSLAPISIVLDGGQEYESIADPVSVVHRNGSRASVRNAAITNIRSNMAEAEIYD